MSGISLRSICDHSCDHSHDYGRGLSNFREREDTAAQRRFSSDFPQNRSRDHSARSRTLLRNATREKELFFRGMGALESGRDSQHPGVHSGVFQNRSPLTFMRSLQFIPRNHCHAVPFDSGNMSQRPLMSRNTTCSPTSCGAGSSPLYSTLTIWSLPSTVIWNVQVLPSTTVRDVVVTGIRFSILKLIEFKQFQ
jgi:hypothetical protein